VVLSAVLIVAIAGMCAFALDLGFVMVVRSQLQRSADAAALAATLELAGDTTDPFRLAGARSVAAQYAGDNLVTQRAPSIDLNPSNDPSGDVVIGTVHDWSQRPVVLDTSDPAQYNAVRVRVQRSATRNGEVPLFFGRVLGHRSIRCEAVATAALHRQIEGFRTPPRPVPLPVLPVALAAADWKAMMDGTSGYDDYSWDKTLQEVLSGGDFVPEVKLYAESNGAAGNFGTVRIGHANNSTSYLSDQILHGMSAADMEYHGGELRFDANGHLMLSGEPGISASIRRDFQAIVGQPRIIPIYDQVTQNGATAVYRIIKFVGIRVMAVQLNGSHLRIMVQPADVSSRGVIPGNDDGTSDFVYSGVHLIE
jgi:hypothetical protein